MLDQQTTPPSSTPLEVPEIPANIKKSSNIPFIIGGVIILILIIIGTFFYILKSKPQTPVVILPTVAPTPADETANWQIYTNTKYHYSLKYPIGWKYVEVPNATYQSIDDSTWFTNTTFPPPQTDGSVPLTIKITTKDPNIYKPEDFDNFSIIPITIDNFIGKEIKGVGKSGLTLHVVIVPINDKYLYANIGNYNADIVTIAKKILHTFKPLDQNQIISSNFQSTNCNFSLSYSAEWKAQQYFLQNNTSDLYQSCAYLTAPDYKSGLDSRTGFYVSLIRTKKGSTFKNVTINTLDDYIKANEAVIEPPTIKVRNLEDITYGNKVGKQYDAIAAEPPKTFIFVKDNYIYDVSWPSSYQGDYKNSIDSIITSIQF